MNSIPEVLLRLEAAANHEGGFPYSHTAKASDIRLLIAAYQELAAALDAAMSASAQGKNDAP